MSRWPLHKAYFWERAPFFRLLLPLIAGILMYEVIPQQFYPAMWGILISDMLVFAITSFSKLTRSWLQMLRFGSLNIAIATLGWVLCYSNDIRNDAGWFGHQHADAYMARISKAPAEKEKTWKLEVQMIGGLTDNAVQSSTGKAFVYAYKDTIAGMPLKEGDTILLPANWQPVKNAGNPFEFDYAHYCAQNNIYYCQFLPANKIILHNSTTPKISWIQKGHNWCMAQLAQYISDKKTLGLMQAMLIGDEANLDNDTRQAYSETGIIHIIAISGSHITFFFVVLSFLLGWLRHRKYHWIKYLAAIPLIWIYVLMSGAPPSAVRAALMFTVLGIGFAFEKQPNTLNYLLATAFLLLCAQPMWLYAVGFQLSFLAVLSLILFYRPVYHWFTPTHFITKGLWGAIAASIAAELLTAPLVIYYFHLFPLLFIVANVAAYLFMGIVLILGMLIVALSSVAPAASVTASVTIFLVTIFDKLVHLMQQMNPAALRYLDINPLELLFLYCAIAALAIWFIKQKRPALFVSLAATCVLLIFLCTDEYKALVQRRLIVYNVLRTDHIELINGKHHSVLFATDTSKQVANYILKPAHTGFHAWRGGDTIAQPVHYVNGRSVLILEQPIDGAGRLHFDDLVVNYPANAYELNSLRQQFSPKRIVLGNAVRHKELPYWISACKAQNIHLHVLSLNGAFIL